MLPIGPQQLHRLAPAASGARAARQREVIAGMGDAFAATLDHYAINTPLRIVHFLAQVAHESDGFCTTEEYASGRAYENRADLGNVRPGDGPLFKGRGLIQLTGRANYRAMGGMLGIDLEGRPLRVNDPFTYLSVSCEFWRSRDINAACDADDIGGVTRLVNGGLAGLASRKAYLSAARPIVAALAAAGASAPADGVPVLHLGCSGDAVAALQVRLATAGYPIARDADFGPATELAVRHLQAASGLVADGIVGATTWAALS